MAEERLERGKAKEEKAAEHMRNHMAFRQMMEEYREEGERRRAEEEE